MSVYKPGNVWQTQEPACCISEIPFVRNLQQFQWIFTHEGQQNQNQFSTIINLYSVKISLNYICLLNWISTIQNNSKLKIRTSKKKNAFILYQVSLYTMQWKRIWVILDLIASCLQNDHTGSLQFYLKIKCTKKDSVFKAL